MVGVGQERMPNLFIKRSGNVGLQTIDPNRIMESDFLVWIVRMNLEQPRFLEAAGKNIKIEHLQVPACANLYRIYLDNAAQGRACDLLGIASQVGEAEQQLINEIVDKKINREKAEQQFIDAMQTILDRNWMQDRQAIAMKINSGNSDDDEVFDLLRQYNQMQKNGPKVEMA